MAGLSFSGLKMYEGGLIDLDRECLIIPIYFNKKIDLEGMQNAFDECINALINEEDKVLKQFI
jgi:hypothetical protein